MQRYEKSKDEFIESKLFESEENEAYSLKTMWEIISKYLHFNPFLYD